MIRWPLITRAAHERDIAWLHALRAQDGRELTAVLKQAREDLAERATIIAGLKKRIAALEMERDAARAALARFERKRGAKGRFVA